jgi:hypothetical protein
VDDRLRAGAVAGLRSLVFIESPAILPTLRGIEAPPVVASARCASGTADRRVLLYRTR